MRGTDPTHHIHVTHKREKTGLISLAFFAQKEKRPGDPFSQMEGASSVEEMKEPGGGRRVSVEGPGGFQIELVHGMETLKKLPLPKPVILNKGEARERQRELQRVAQGAAHVKRLGHVAVNYVNMEAARRWFEETLGFLVSDHVLTEENAPPAGYFMRCDLGKRPTDHHTVLVQQGEDDSLNHMGFEVHDFDDLGAGQQYLYKKKRHHMWGIGRHLLGSQIYDYWRDPWGHGIEHWTDGDLLDTSYKTGSATFEQALFGQWGPIPPSTFGRTVHEEEYDFGRFEP